MTDAKLHLLSGELLAGKDSLQKPIDEGELEDLLRDDEANAKSGKALLPDGALPLLYIRNV